MTIFLFEKEKSLKSIVPRLYFSSFWCSLFLYKLQSTNRTRRLHSDKINAAVQPFKVERGQVFSLLDVNLLAEAVEHHDVAFFLWQADADLTWARVGIQRQPVLVLLIHSNISIKDELDVGTLVGDFFWAHK